MVKAQSQDIAFRQATEFSSLWRELFQKLEAGLKAQELTPEMEDEFLKLKSRIALRKQMLVNVLADEFTVGDDAMKVLIESPSLDAMRNESPIKINSIKGQWHEVFIAVNKMMGRIKEKKVEEAKKGFLAKVFKR